MELSMELVAAVLAMAVVAMTSGVLWLRPRSADLEREPLEQELTARTIVVSSCSRARAAGWMQDVAQEITVSGLRPAERAAVAAHLGWTARAIMGPRWLRWVPDCVWTKLTDIPKFVAVPTGNTVVRAEDGTVLGVSITDATGVDVEKVYDLYHNTPTKDSGAAYG